MRYFSTLLILLLPLLSFATEPRPRRSFEEMVAMPLVHPVPGTDRVEVRANLKYSAVEDPNLLMDIYLPPGLDAGTRRPVVVFLHGGAGSGARAKDWGYYQSWGRSVAASGLIGVTLNHRLAYPNPHLTEAVADVDAALAYLRARAADLPLDLDRIGLVAVSAAGPLLSPAMRDKPPHIRALVSINTFLDLQQSAPHREHEPADRLKAFSCLTHLDADAARIAPMLIIRGGADEIPGINESIDRFMARAVPANANLTYVNHPTGDHSFVTQKDDVRSREIVRNVLDFLLTHLGEKS